MTKHTSKKETKTSKGATQVPDQRKTTEPKAVDLAAEEKKLKEAYPEQKIVKGSLRDAGTIPEFGNKRTIEIHCQRTNKVFRVATSDLHQVKFCKEAIKEIRLERRKEQRKAKRMQETKATPKKPETPKKPATKKPATKKPAKKPAAKKAVKVLTPAQEPEEAHSPIPTMDELQHDTMDELQHDTGDEPIQ